MIYSCYDGMFYVESELFSKYGIKHLFTTIKDDKLKREIDYSFRLRDREEVIQNYQRVADFFNLPLYNFVKSTQIHENNIVHITSYHKGMGILRETELDNADGIFTNEAKLPLCIFSADCVPILIADKKKRVVAGVHAGWRGTAKDIIGKAIRLIKEKYDITGEDLIFAIGPAIGQCCFEVSCDVISALDELYVTGDFCYKKENGKYQLDLKGFNKALIKKENIPEENIDLCDLCTKCEEEFFHSYRRQGDNSGRNAGFIAL